MGSAFNKIMAAPEVLMMMLGQLGSKTLRPTACVCRAWYSVAVDVIWRDCKLLALLEIFAPLEYDIQVRQWRFNSSVLGGNWERFSAHARLVRTMEYNEVRIRSHEGPNALCFTVALSVMSGIQVARDLHRGTHLFPNLRNLTWTCREDCMITYMTYIMVNAPELVGIQSALSRVRAPTQIKTQIVHHLGATSPASLQTLHLRLSSSFPSSEDNASLQVAFIECLESLGRRTQLRRLTVSPLRLTREITAPVLRTLPNLQDLRIQANATTASELQDYLHQLAHAAPQLRLLVISAPDLSGASAGVATLRPLRECTQLKELHLVARPTFGLSFDPEDIRSIGRLWPGLKALHLSCARRPNGMMMPIEWLCHFASAFSYLVRLGIDFTPGVGPPHPDNLSPRFARLQRLAVGFVDPQDSCGVGELLGEMCPPGVTVHAGCPCMQAMPDENDGWDAMARQWGAATAVMNVVHRAHASEARRNRVAAGK